MNTLSTPTSTALAPNRQEFVSFARGFAILTIVFFHLFQKIPLSGLLYQGVALGGAGIYIYFFFSGFGLAKSSSGNWLQFYRKRFIKVLIPYYVAVTLIFTIILFVPLYSVEGWKEYFSHIFQYKMFNYWYTRNLGEHFWFVSTIVQFYLAMPLLSWFQNRTRPATFLIGTLLISISYSCFIIWLDVMTQRIWYSFFLQYLWVFGLGMTASRNGWLQRFISQPWYVYVISAAISLKIVQLIVEHAGAAGGLFNDYFMFLGYGSLLVLSYQLTNSLPFLRRFVLWVEPFSYSLYLTHIVVMHLYGYTISPRAFSAPDMVLIAGLALVVGFVYQKGIDWLLQRKIFQV